MSNEQEIRDLFSQFKVPINKDDVWMVQQNYVVRHKALERLAAKLNIQFDNPQWLRAERDEAVVLVTGRRGDYSEWSVGEAAIGSNYRVSGKMASYVYAMAEKRGKDRVILKLAGLYGVYSEDEADDFKAAAPKETIHTPSIDAPPVKETQPVEPFTAEGSNKVKNRMLDELSKITDFTSLHDWAVKNNSDFSRLSEEHQNEVSTAHLDHTNHINNQQRAA